MNVKTGEFKEFDKEDRLVNVLGCDYDANATCPNFDAFLESLFVEKETGTQLLRAIASCLVKDTSPMFKKFFFLLQGPTGTGKTTLINTILSLMGSYGKASKYQTFMKTSKEYTGSQHNQDIVELIGKQFISCSEPSDTSVFAADFLKAFTGGSSLSVRAAYGRKFIDFTNTGLLFIDSNFTPKIQTFDTAAMDRFQVFPFLKTPIKKDEELHTKLQNELSGIFNRIYAELIKLYDEPFSPTNEMTAYKNQYKEESSDILQWFRESFDLADADKSKISFTSIYSSFEGWCAVNNKQAISKNLFSKRFKDETGYDCRKISGNVVVIGLEYTKLGSVYSDYHKFEKRSDFYKKIDEVTRPEDATNVKLTYRSVRQALLSKSASWFANNIDLFGKYEEESKKYHKYTQDCIFDLVTPLLIQDFELVVSYLLTNLEIKRIISMTKGDIEARMVLTDTLRRVSLEALKKAA